MLIANPSSAVLIALFKIYKIANTITEFLLKINALKEHFVYVYDSPIQTIILKDKIFNDITQNNDNYILILQIIKDLVLNKNDADLKKNDADLKKLIDAKIKDPNNNNNNEEIDEIIKDFIQITVDY